MNRKHRTIAKTEPGYEGRFEIGVMTLDDPCEPATKIKTRINIRHDVLLHWRSRKQIDDAQFLAGQRLQKIWHQAQFGHIGSSFPGNDKVDTSGVHDFMPMRMITAKKELSEAAAFLGVADYGLVIRVVCEGRSITDEAKSMGGGTPERNTAWLVRRALSNLAGHWGATGKKSLPIKAFHAI